MAYTQIDNPELYMQVKLYTGNGTTQSITFDNTDTSMQPDMVWIKCRNIGFDPCVFDSVRGVHKTITPSETYVENHGQGSNTDSLTAFNSNGFSIGDDVSLNQDTSTFVSWCWKAGTSFSNDASATSIGTIDSSGSVNDTAGISICSFTGTGSNGSIKHGLSTVPNMIITKSRANAENWGVYHQGIGNTHAVYLNTTAAKIDEAAYYQDTTPTSSIFTVGTADATNDAATMIAYCFAPKQGFSKFGSYTGNGNADGTFVYTGFRPAMVMLKQSSEARNWLILDNKRDTHNPYSQDLLANASDAEQTNVRFDSLSNGFKFRLGSSASNKSGETYIYMAFAEAPLVNSNGVPCNG